MGRRPSCAGESTAARLWRFPGGKRFGIRLLSSWSGRELGDMIDLRYEPAGVVFDLTVPLRPRKTNILAQAIRAAVPE